MITDLLLDLDHKAFFFIQRLQRPWLDPVLAEPTRLGETLITLTVTLALLWLLERKKASAKIAVSAAALLSAHWASQWLKELFRRPRPHLVLENVHTLLSRPSGYALPSGHASLVFCAAFLFASFYPRHAWIAWIIAAWLGMTRVYVGVHYPTDVLGGAVCGIFCGALALKILKS